MQGSYSGATSKKSLAEELAEIYKKATENSTSVKKNVLEHERVNEQEFQALKIKTEQTLRLATQAKAREVAILTLEEKDIFRSGSSWIPGPEWLNGTHRKLLNWLKDEKLKVEIREDTSSKDGVVVGRYRIWVITQI